jgi:putative photosynthetic complex assembly protein 2
VLQYGLPVLFTLFLWWFSTGLILYLDGLPRHTFRWSLLGVTLVQALALYGLAVSGADTRVAGAYLAFGCALLVWAWVEMTFLMGWITGPRRAPCPEGCTGRQRFGYAVLALLYHELAIIACAAAVIALTWRQPNQVGTWTFLILWGMRLSTKLNVFLGVRNLNEEWLPEPLQHLRSFFTQKPMNLLFPVSVTAATAIATLLIQRLLEADIGAFEVVGLTLLATLTVLAILEHWFLVLPLPFEALWHWGLRSRAAQAPAKGDDCRDSSGQKREPNPSVTSTPLGTQSVC